jgi:hypothetical protein
VVSIVDLERAALVALCIFIVVATVYLIKRI